ncbi:putative gustatory receptor 28a [Vespula maculifrons]|uniref:Gustatory receptor n=1 Tax=Vespula maculifrons TaxID=7453 RepID=A0ABD2B5I1_VESMC
MHGRGAFLALEGCDKVGKTTQVKLLVEALNNLGIVAEAKSFPNRTTKIGELLNKFLLKEIELPSEAAHLLFSANRWECRQDIIKALQAGTTLIIDRYAASGAAYTSAATGRSLTWCQEVDRGLPSPDLIVFLKVPEQMQNSHMWDGERYDNMTFQQKVSSNYDKLNDGTWKVINGQQDLNVIHQELLRSTLDIIEQVKNRPINRNIKMEFRPKTFDLEIAFAASRKRQMKKFRGPDSPLYSAICPAIYIIRILGQAPYKFSKDRLVPSNVYLIFSFVFLTVCFYNVYVVFYQFLHSTRKEPILGGTEYIKVTFNCFTMIYSVLMTMSTRNKFVQIWNNIQDYDDAVRLLGYPQKEIKTRIVCWILITLNIALWTSVNQIGMYAFTESWISNIGYMSPYFGSCIAVYKFIGITFILGQRFHHLNELATKYIYSKRKNTRPMKIDIKTIQTWHNELMIVGENLNTLYTWEILLWLANLSIHSVSDLYFIIDKVLNDWDNLHWPSICCLASWSLVFVAQLIILHISCDYVSTQANCMGGILIDWQACLMEKNSLKTPIEMSLHFINRKLQFTAAGCFCIELPLIRSIAALLTTYLVILLQLQ